MPIKRSLVRVASLLLLVAAAIAAVAWLRDRYAVGWLNPVTVAYTAGSMPTDLGIYRFDLREQIGIRLTPADLQAARPTWAPDASRLAFVYARGSRETGVALVRRDGGAPRVLVSTPTNANPSIQFEQTWLAWSADGTQILYSVFTVDADGSVQAAALRVVDVTSGDSEALAIPLDLSGPDRPTFAWGPAQLAAVGVGGRIYLVDPAAQTVTWFTSGSDPFWTPSGDRLAFVCEDGGTALCVVNRDGSDRRVFRPEGLPGYDDIRFSWSPGGRFIVYGWRPGDTEWMYVMYYDTWTELSHRVYRTTRTSDEPMWDPPWGPPETEIIASPW